MMENKDQEAIESFNESLKILESGKAMYAKGLVLHKLGKDQLACEALAKASSLGQKCDSAIKEVCQIK